MISNKLKTKLINAEDILRREGSPLVAFSGGVDSSLLAFLAHKLFRKNMLAVTASSETYTPEELNKAQAFARKYRMPHTTITTLELSNPKFANNPPQRCFYCKSELFKKLDAIRRKRGLHCILDGTNTSDSGDFRPGRKAALAIGVKSPFLEADISKDDVRALARHFHLESWNAPAAACLASRFPYGEKITTEKLARVAKAEAYLRSLGAAACRVRSHGDIARIELPADKIGLALKRRGEIVDKLRSLGYTYVALDLQGYRTGSMNEVLPKGTGRAK